MCIMMYISTVSFYPPKRLQFMAKPLLRTTCGGSSQRLPPSSSRRLFRPTVWLEPLVAFTIVERPPGSEGQDANIISYKDSEPITGTCGAAEATDYVPNSFHSRKFRHR